MNRKFRKYIPVLLILVLVVCSFTNGEVHLNDIQVIGSHNSYKIAIEEPLFNYLFKLDSSRAKRISMS